MDAVFWFSSVVFATEDGVTCSTELDPLRVEFFDLFQPPPSLAGIQVSSAL